MYYECEVIETVTIKKRYLVEADSAEDALDAATLGDTVEEETLGDPEEVIARDVTTPMKEVK